MNNNEKLEKILLRYRINENHNDDFFNEEMNSTNRLFGLKDLLEFYQANKEWKVIEIGSYAGASAELISNYVGEITCCDIWEQYIMPLSRATKVYEEFLLTKERNKNIIEIKKQSSKLANEYADDFFDMVYIDADHSYKSVKTDISSWFKKVKQGGIICGHDYYMEEVKKAVDEFFGEEKVKYFRDSSWSYKKNKD
jgi:predicted O-methyltransferase YrrM